jgi:hypothetical protein
MLASCMSRCWWKQSICGDVRERERERGGRERESSFQVVPFDEMMIIVMIEMNETSVYIWLVAEFFCFRF